MYKMLLCLRYLRTRYIALASIISVTLGVATMIVVNSVMSGFSTEMRDRLHSVLSDVVLESKSINGFRDAEAHMAHIRKVAGDAVEAVTPTVMVPAMLNYQYQGQWITRQVDLIGIDETTLSQVCDFGRYLQHPENRRQMSFELRHGGYDVHDHQSGPEAPPRTEMATAGWPRRREMAEREAFLRHERTQREPGAAGPGGTPPVSSGDVSGLPLPPEAPAGAAATAASTPPPNEGPTRTNLLRQGDPSEPAPAAADPFAAAAPANEDNFDPAKQTHTGAVLGIGLCSFRDHDGVDRFLALPGDDVKLTFPTAGTPPEGKSADFTVVDFYECKMSEYDAKFVFVPLRVLQELRGLIDPETGKGLVNAIQIKIRPGANDEEVRDRLRAAFPSAFYAVSTWKDKQGPLLAAVQMETAILNVLLFLIIAVAGFGILAIFLMIVVEKTRDIGILKSLGASRAGIMGIFLGYGLSLGLVGSLGGMILGLWFTHHINGIADLLGRITGQPVFDPAIYYFYKIPTIVDPWTVAWIVSGALGIAVLASILPALRAALLHPVEALRYE